MQRCVVLSQTLQRQIYTFSKISQKVLFEKFPLINTSCHAIPVVTKDNLIHFSLTQCSNSKVYVRLTRNALLSRDTLLSLPIAAGSARSAKSNRYFTFVPSMSMPIFDLLTIGGAGKIFREGALYKKRPILVACWFFLALYRAENLSGFLMGDGENCPTLALPMLYF